MIVFSGKIPHYSLPPARCQDEDVNIAILSQFSKEFNVDDIYQNESRTLIARLPSLVESIHVELPANIPVSMETHQKLVLCFCLSL